MNGIIKPAPGLERLVAGTLARMNDRIHLLSGQVNYLLEELYIATNGKHGSFNRNKQLADDTRRSVELRKLDRARVVKETTETPDFTAREMGKMRQRTGLNDLSGKAG